MKNKINLNIEVKAEEFLELVLPEGACDIQVAETKKAFLAGMNQAIKDVVLIADLPSNEADNALSKYIFDIEKTVQKNWLES